MPVLPHSTYQPPRFLGRRPHLQSILPAKLRRVYGVAYLRERIDTPDGDFLDLDWSRIGAKRLVIVSHGLEGSSRRSYVMGMVRAFNAAGWDALGWNYRGCSGEPNRQLGSYHSGATYDLDTVVQHALPHYDTVVLVGFSLGGNLTLKYLGERGADVDARIRSAVAFSVPCDLAAGSKKLAESGNRIYMWYFLRSLHKKVQQKMTMFPGEIDDANYNQIRTFADFDNRYTAPMHGFRDADDYWRRCSSKPLLTAIRIPTLLVNAQDDPFLPDACYPTKEAQASQHVTLEMPRYGGHVGFMSSKGGATYWSEERAVAFAHTTSDFV